VFLARPLDGWLQQLPALMRSWSARLVVFLAIVTLLHIGISAPLSFYSGFVVEHRFGLSKLSLAGWLWRYTKRNLLALAFSAAMALGLYWVIWTTGPWWWLVAAGAFFVVSIVLGQLAPVLILPLFYRIEKLDAPELRERIGRLAQGTGLSIDGVYRINISEETAKANAMLTGLGRTRRVLLGDTLLGSYTPEEIEVVFAHEIGHHVHRHIPKMLAAGLVYSTLGFWVCERLLAAWVVAVQGTVDYHVLPVWTLAPLMLILSLFAMLVEPLQNAISRRYERQADRYALRRTGLREAYLAAFRKLARLNKDDPNPHWLDVLLFHSHPPIAERLAMADDPGAE
jgi:STE24 endopeptidase